uniref:histidine kinase n=1 Tax=Magnetococcus massalia (strain MO-1) TaxID=451514 RepID=A0A1S7LHM8_MAGMO|nr:Putative Histidine kinase with HAMP domain and HATPase_c domain [Candidatus Magnetococcus massalia]
MKLFSRYTNLPLFWQLLLPMVVVTLLWLSSTIYSLLGLGEAHGQLRNLYTNEVRTVFQVEDLHMRIIRIHLLLLRHLSSENAQQMSQLESKIEEQKSSLLNNLQALKRSYELGHDEETLDFAKTKQAYLLYFSSVGKLLSLSSDFEKEPAFELLNNYTRKALQRINDLTLSISSQEAFHMKSGFHDALELQKDNYLVSLLFSLLVVMMTLLIVWRTAKGTSQRLARVVDGAESLGQGNLTTRMKSHGQDEISQLVDHLNLMASNLEHTMAQERHVSLAFKHAKNEVEEANQQLLATQDQLEERVLERTKSLAASEQRLAAELTIRSAMNQLLQHTAEADSLQSVMEATLQVLLAQRFLGLSEQGAFLIMNPESRHMELGSSVNFPPSILQMCGVDPNAQCTCNEALQDGTVRYSSVTAPQEEQGKTEPVTHHFLAVPVLADANFTGLIVLLLEQAHQPTDADIFDFLQSVSAVVASAMRRLSMLTTLVQQEKLASLGEMVAGVAHEVNTPVGIGVTAASELSEKTKNFKKMYHDEGISEEELQSYLDNVAHFSELIQQNMLRAGTLVRSFKMVAVDQSSEERRHFKLKQNIEAVITSLNHMVRKQDITITLACPEKIDLYSYPGAFAQIFTNLIQNSLLHGFSAGERGRITIDVMHEGAQLVFYYRDSGCGIPLAQRKQIFEPFYTTQRTQGGSGLGMHVTFNLVTHLLEGTIICEEPDEQGAQFRISMPWDSVVMP